MDVAANSAKTFRVFWIWIGVLVLLDQLTKALAIHYLKQNHPVAILPGFFNLCYVENQGAAWGILHGRQIFLVTFSLVTLGFLFWKRFSLFGQLRGGTFIFALLIAGILGNLIDRIWVGHVVDFLDFHYQQRHFPAFNVADSAICIATFLMIFAQWGLDRRDAREPAHASL
jgi:signal peptidase II